MFDHEKCQRCVKVAKSWYGTAFDRLCKRKETDPGFRGEWDEAQTVLESIEQGEALPSWHMPAGVHTMMKTGYRMEATYYFMTSSEFVRRYSMEPKVANIKVVALRSEEGTKSMHGILFKGCPGAEAYRKVVFFSETVWYVDEELLQPAGRLREKEPVETYHSMNTIKAKEHPAAHINYLFSQCGGTWPICFLGTGSEQASGLHV